MSGAEASSWTWLRDGIKRIHPMALLERVENGLSAGMADVNYLIDGVEGWVEMKAVILPKRPSTAVLGAKGLNPDQVNWHLKRDSCRGRTFIFVTAQPYRWLVGGIRAKFINEWTAQEFGEKARLHICGKWIENDWRQLCSALTDTLVPLAD